MKCMSILIDKPLLFKEALKTGINLFTGAGFSKLPDLFDSQLPDASDLCEEICDKFSISKAYSTDLERLSNIVNQRAKQQFQKYLREKYSVYNYNPLYNSLNLINIHSYITTNIDNIIQCVMDNSAKYHLHDVVLYGAIKKDSTAIPYIPLHGEVNNPNANLYFGKNELANVDNDNRELFSVMYSKLLEAPTLFCGYGFHDNAVERTIAKILEKHRHNIWIQCMPGSDNIDYFRDLGCYIIEGNTENILKWFESELVAEIDSPSDPIDAIFLKKYGIPSRNQLEAISRQDYFLNANTHWYCVLSDYACETKNVNNLYEEVLGNKNVIAIGIPFSGKTTLLMQLSAKIQADVKLCISDGTPELARLIINKLAGRKAILFVDDCCEDIEAFKLLMQQDNIRLIGFTDDYAFESSKHLIDDIQYKKINVSELDVEDAQKIYEKLPQSIRVDDFMYKHSEDEKFSMLEMMGKNVRGILSRERVKTVLERIRKKSPDGFEIVALATYLSTNNSALSTDILIAYLGTADYALVKTLIETAQGYLTELDVTLWPDAIDQDYYNIRSHLFSHLANSILSTTYKNDFRQIIRRFILNVPPYRIYKNYIFKRSAYDALMFYNLFGSDAHDLYHAIYQFDSSAYTLQQWALYKAYLKDYSGAFSDIDKAINMNQNNFSIKNTRAIILFEANKGKKSEPALTGMTEAMETLQQCFNSDKRKVYHAKKYSEFALYLAKEWNEFQYIPQAKQWLETIINSGESTSRATRDLLRDVINLMSK